MAAAAARGFSFTPSGLCFPYGLGAASALADAGVLGPDVPLGGASGGGLVAAVMGTGRDVDESLDAALRVNKYCRDRGTARFNLKEPLEMEIDALLDENAADSLNSRPGKVEIAITRFTPFPRGEAISNFTGASDLKSALLATSCIPFYFSKSPFVFYRQWPAVDGIFASPTSYFGAPELSRASKTVRICPFEASSVGLRGESITPSLRRRRQKKSSSPPPPPLGDLVACALGSPPVDDDFLLRLFEQGRADAEIYLDQEG